MVGRQSIAPRASSRLAVAVPGGTIAVTEQGRGLPVLFLHGGTGTGELDWGAVADALARRYRAVVVDLRGHGGSATSELRLGVVRFGLDTLHVLRALGLARAVLVGFSVGGTALLSMLAWDARPALGLVTVGASVRGDPERLQTIMSGPWPDYLVDVEHAVGDGPGYWRTLRAHLAHDWATNVSLGETEVRRIGCPTLVCHGTEDRVQHPSAAQTLAEWLPQGELWLVDGAGHAVQRDCPQAFIERLEEFLDRVKLGR